MTTEPEWMKDWTEAEKAALAYLTAKAKELDDCTHAAGFGRDDCCLTCGKLCPPMKEPSFW